MPGLVPGIHAETLHRRSRTGRRPRQLDSLVALHAGVDGRDKPGHDGMMLVYLLF
ncbi:hypothetical protein M2323_000714 [Rhodoblastus acidophilus]|uniref:hypothetical protein n=1 Tax=Rhodoblastus acidophilus TaxID=1074 RepID=UPI002224DB72|nr:hypothetical protein [Rhodoblastus acidophilus]MCW2283139.1 hypothetical protein [Rhodoblastus acidophilus]MCW2331810.1 hypothetical protein [Rhodoblastus acidophilus]